MSTTLFGRSARAAIHERIDRLSPERVGQWGTMAAREMVCHAADQLRVAIGDLSVRAGPLRLRFGDREVKVPPGPLRFRCFRRVLVHPLPWPKARIGASPEMLTTSPAEWHDDVAALHALVDRVGQKDPAERWGTDSILGRVSGQEWGLLCWRHLDHHLRQFGV